MENFYKYAGINKTFSLILYTLWIFSQADGESMSAVAGSTVNLHCSSQSISNLMMLEWKMNWDQLLIRFLPDQPPYITPKAQSLKVSMSTSESQLYALNFETVQFFHKGNYTCTTNTAAGVWEQTWTLETTDHVKVHTRALLMYNPTEEPLVVSPSIISLIFYLFAFLLCGVILLVCLCRKRESSEDLTLTYVEYQIKFGEEEVTPSLLGQSCVEYSVTESTLEGAQFSVFPSMHDARVKTD